MTKIWNSTDAITAVLRYAEISEHDNKQRKIAQNSYKSDSTTLSIPNLLPQILF